MAGAPPASQQQQPAQAQRAAGGPAGPGSGSSNGSSPASSNPKRVSRWATGGPPSFKPNTPGQPGNSGARSQSPLNPVGQGQGLQGQRQYSNNNCNAATATAQSSQAGPAFQNIVASPEELGKMHDRMLFLISHMIGQTVTATVRTGIVYQGILSTVNDADLSVCLRLARQLDPSSASSTSPAPIKPSLLISAKDIIDLSAESVEFTAFTQQPSTNGSNASRPVSPTIKDPGGASIMAALMNGSSTPSAAGVPDSFRTDVDISNRSGARDNRELRKWGSSAAWGDGGSSADGGIGGSSLEGDDATFGGLEEAPSGGKGGKAWDQFAVNEKLFGTKTNYQEELYTTKLDKSGADYRARELRAERLAQEIQSGVASNAHVAEERGLQVDDSGLDEEDKYSGVIRGQGAYVPPGARKTAGNAGALAPKQAQPQATASDSNAVNGSLAQKLRDDASKKDGTPALNVTEAASQQASSKPVAPDASATPQRQQQQPEVVGDFRKFVSSEKEKLLNKKAAMQRQDKDKKFADLRSFSASFTLKTPIPSDLVPILTKDEQKQKDLLIKSPQLSAVAGGASASNSASTVKPASTNVSPNVGPATLQKTPSTPQQAAPVAAGVVSAARPGQLPPPAVAPKKASPYALAEIPPFNPAKAAAARAARAAASATSAVDGSSSKPTTTKFNAAAPTFVMRPTAGSFVPGGAAPSAVPAVPPVQQPSFAPKPQAPVPERAPNPFFGLDSPVDKARKQLTHVKEEFSPFKLGKCPDASSMPHTWGFTGKSLHSVASPAPSTIGIMSPQLAGALPPHMMTAQMRAMHISSPPPPQYMMQGMSAASAAGGPGPASLMRTASSTGNPPSTADETTTTASGIQSSGTGTPLPSSSTSQAGHAGPPPQQSAQGVMPAGFTPQMQHGHPAQMLPQGYVFHPGQQQQQPQPGGFPGQHGGYRFAAPGPGQQGAGHIVIGPNGQPVHFVGHPGAAPGPHGPFAQMQPFSPQMHGVNNPMFSPQMGTPGQPYMPPMFVPQGGPRGTPQMAPGGQHIFYQQMGGPQYVPMQYAGGPPQPGQPHQQGQGAQQQQQ